MQKDDFVLEIPYGTRDFLPEEAAEKRIIETKLADIFSHWGYDEIVTPTIEYLDTLTLGNGKSIEDHMFKLFDKTNHTLALRHEMTTPISRVVASRFMDEILPLKLSYISNVYRYEQSQTGRQCEFYQAGVELVGSSEAAADAEIIALAVEGMKKSGLKNFLVCIGQIEFIEGLMQQFKFSEETQEAYKSALENRDLVSIDNIVETSDLPVNAKSILKELPLLHGGEEMLKKAYGMALNEQCRRALDNLCEIQRLLKVYGVDEYVTFDLGIVRDSNYYTGVVFEVYTPGLGFPLCGGGRYDRMLSNFGTSCPATGFAIGIERIMLALERQGLTKPALNKDVYVSYEAGQAEAAIKKVMELREEGLSVELALSPQSKTAAEEYRNSKGFSQLVYIGLEK